MIDSLTVRAVGARRVLRPVNCKSDLHRSFDARRFHFVDDVRRSPLLFLSRTIIRPGKRPPVAARRASTPNRPTFPATRCCLRKADAAVEARAHLAQYIISTISSCRPLAKHAGQMQSYCRNRRRPADLDSGTRERSYRPEVIWPAPSRPTATAGNQRPLI